MIPEPLATFIIENAVHSKSWLSMAVFSNAYTDTKNTT